MSKPFYPDVSDKSVNEMSSSECRLIIAKEVGLNRSPHSPFGKAHLNSIHAYFEGEPFFEREKYYTPDSPHIGEIRLGIARIIGLDFDPGPDFVRPFKRSHLRKIVKEVKSTSDQRKKPSKRE